MAPWAPKTHREVIRERRGGLTPKPRPWVDYSSQQWQAIRARVILRDPVCRSCRTQSSTVADHIVPRSQGGGDEMSNLRGVCEVCHNRKTGGESEADQQRYYGDSE